MTEEEEREKEGVSYALRKLGFTKSEIKEEIERALRKLGNPPRFPDASKLLEAVLFGRCRRV